MGKCNLWDFKIKDVIYLEFCFFCKINFVLVNNELSDYMLKYILYMKLIKEKEKEGFSSDSR